MLVSIQDEALFLSSRLGISFYTLSFDVSETSNIILQVTENKGAPIRKKWLRKILLHEEDLKLRRNLQSDDHK
jgi:hypothetical protein